MACLRDSTIQAYLAEFASGQLHHTVEDHLARCVRCRATFDRIAQTNRRVHAWLSKLAPLQNADPIDIVRARERVLIPAEPRLFQPIRNRANPRALLSSLILQSAIVAAALLTGTATVMRTPPSALTLIAPPPMHRAVQPKSSRGGGGQPSLLPPPKGIPIRTAPKAFTQPLLSAARPALTMNPALIESPDAWATPSGLIGNPFSELGGAGNPGNGKGPGNGPGAGPGSGDDAGIFAVGAGVSKPELLVKIEPEYSEEARKAKYSGAVLLSIVVNTDGTAMSIRVTRSLGMGLDEKAIEAVQKWHFKPAMSNGKPVRVRADVEVNFRLL